MNTNFALTLFTLLITYYTITITYNIIYNLIYFLYYYVVFDYQYYIIFGVCAAINHIYNLNINLFPY